MKKALQVILVPLVCLGCATSHKVELNAHILVDIRHIDDATAAQAAASGGDSQQKSMGSDDTRSISIKTAYEPLVQRMAARRPEITALLKKGAFGEANTGFLKARIASTPPNSLVNQENADRKALFAEIAKQNPTAAMPLEEIGAHYALQKADSAASGTWIQAPDANPYYTSFIQKPVGRPLGLPAIPGQWLRVP